MESDDVTNGNAEENKPPVNFILGGEHEPEIIIEEEPDDFLVGGRRHKSHTSHKSHKSHKRHESHKMRKNCHEAQSKMIN